MAGETSSKKQMFGQNLEVSTCKEQVQVEMIVACPREYPGRAGYLMLEQTAFQRCTYLGFNQNVLSSNISQTKSLQWQKAANQIPIVQFPPASQMFYNGFCLSKFDHIPQHLDAVLLLSALWFRGAAGHELSASGTDPIPQHYITWLKFFVKWDGGGNFDFLRCHHIG